MRSVGREVSLRLLVPLLLRLVVNDDDRAVAALCRRYARDLERPSIVRQAQVVGEARVEQVENQPANFVVEAVAEVEQLVGAIVREVDLQVSVDDEISDRKSVV